MMRLVVAAILAAAALPASAQVKIEVGGGDRGMPQIPDDDIIRDFSGVAVVLRNGQIVHQHVSGMADAERGIPNRFDTRFNLASLGKVLTQIAVAQLVAKGRLDLDQPVGTYLPDYPNREIREKASVRDLLEFKAGLPEIWNERFFANPKAVDSLADYVALFADKPLLFAPGTRTEYSNSAYILLGRIVETLSGMSYPEYVQRFIAEPAGMTQTGFDRHDALQPGTAIGYKLAGMGRTPGAGPSPHDRPAAGDAAPRGHGANHSPHAPQIEPNTAALPGRGSSAGGGYSSVPDFIKLERAVRNGILVPKDQAAKVLGEGMAVAGGFPGVSTVAIFLPGGVTAIAFGNRGFIPADRMAEILLERYGKK